jgi:hypothetical protein
MRCLQLVSAACARGALLLLALIQQNSGLLCRELAFLKTIRRQLAISHQPR